MVNIDFWQVKQNTAVRQDRSQREAGRFKRASSVGLALLLGSRLVLAQDATEDATMLRLIQQKHPELGATAAYRTELPEIYEIVSGRRVAYVDWSGRYLFPGSMIDMQTKRDLTADRLDKLSRIEVSQFSLADAIKVVRGSGSRTMYLFSDPDCPFCQRLEKALDEMTDVTIYIFLLPMESLHPGSTAKSVSIWCASDRQAAWRAAVYSRNAPSARDCKNPVARNVSLGQNLGIVGTPTMFSADGRRLVGALPVPYISAWLDQAIASESLR